MREKGWKSGNVEFYSSSLMGMGYGGIIDNWLRRVSSWFSTIKHMLCHEKTVNLKVWYITIHGNDD